MMRRKKHRSEICSKESLLKSGKECERDNQHLLRTPQMSANHYTRVKLWMS